MNPIKLSALFFTGVMLTACGGGGSPTGTNNTTGGGDGGTTTTDGDGNTTTTSTTVGQAGIGSGTGSSFQQNTISVSDSGLTNGELEAGGQVNISVDVVDVQNGNARISGTEYGVVFSSTCAGTTPAQASFDNPEIVVTSGTATTTYRAEGCAGDDVVTATLYNSTGGTIDTGTVLARANATITVEAPIVNDISYVSTTANLLGIQSVGNPDLPQVSEVTFKVTDINGDAIANQQVDFSLSVADSSATLSKSSEITNPAGEVTAILNAGPLHASVQVIAATTFTNASDQQVTTFAASDVISVTTGFPVQSKFELVADTFNPHAWGFSGNTINVTAFMADRWGNPPADGTRINFVTEGGTMVEQSCTTSAGSCSVEWRGQDRRPGDVNNTANSLYVNDRAGFSTITAYSVGDADYIDANNNGLFDTGEAFVSYPEVFEDFDFNGTKDASEELLADTDNDGSFSAADGAIYQGHLCSDTAKQAGHCANSLHVRDSLRIVMSSEVATLSLYQTNGAAAPASLAVDTPYYAVLRDVNGNIPAAGTSLSFAAEGFEIIGKGGEVPTTGLGDLSGIPAMVTAGVPYGAIYSFTIGDADPADNPATPSLVISITPVIDPTYDVNFGITP